MDKAVASECASRRLKPQSGPTVNLKPEWICNHLAKWLVLGYRCNKRGMPGSVVVNISRSSLCVGPAFSNINVAKLRCNVPARFFLRTKIPTAAIANFTTYVFFHVSGWCETLWIDSSTILNLVLLVDWVVFDWHFESFIAFWNFQHFWPYKKLFLPYILQNIDNFVINFTVSSFEISVAAAVFPPISIFINTRILYSVRSATCGLRHPFPLADAVGFCSECWANGSTARELFPRTHPLTPNTKLDSPQVPFFQVVLWPDRESNPFYKLWWCVLNQLLYHLAGCFPTYVIPIPRKYQYVSYYYQQSLMHCRYRKRWRIGFDTCSVNVNHVNADKIDLIGGVSEENGFCTFAVAVSGQFFFRLTLSEHFHGKLSWRALRSGCWNPRRNVGERAALTLWK